MNLYHETWAFWGWFAQVVKKCLQIRPATTLIAVTASAAGSMARLLSLLLPLKIILLAGSDGVPHYFPFIEPGDKMGWITGLGVLAVGCYFLALFLEALVARWSRDAGIEISRGANKLAILNNQEQAAQDLYADVCSICAILLFLCASFLVLGVLKPGLFLFLAAMLSAQYIFTAWALGGRDLDPGFLKSRIQEKTGDYLKLLASLCFLGSFLVLLIPFLTGSGGNKLVALMAIILIRRAMDFLVRGTKTALSLYRDQNTINALVFPDIQLQRGEDKAGQALRKLFHKQARQDTAERELARALDLRGSLEVRWTDSPVRGLSMLSITVVDGFDLRHYQQQIFPPKHRQLLENETFLFQHIDRERLLAPKVITRFSQAFFECQICDHGTGRSLDPEEWKDLRPQLVLHYWTCQPPKALIRAFTASHTLLHQRLNDDLVARLETAVDTPDEARTLQTFEEQLPQVREHIATLPLYVLNPDISRKNTIRAGQDQIRIMTWGRWTLEPIGTVMPGSFDQETVAWLVEKMHATRDDTPLDLDPGWIFLAYHCRKLERNVAKGAYKAALKSVEKIVGN